MKVSLLIIILIFTLAFISSAQTFNVPISMTDGINSYTIYLGAHPSATDGFDPGIDSDAPPPIPSGFYAEERWNGERYWVDIRAAIPCSLKSHEYSLFGNSYPFDITWDLQLLANFGSFVIDDDTNFLDMTVTDHLHLPNGDYPTFSRHGLPVIFTPYICPCRSISDQELSGNFPTYIVANLDTVFTRDPDFPISYTVATDNNISAELSGNQLWLSSIENVTGSSQVIVCAQVEQVTVCDSFIVFIEQISVEEDRLTEKLETTLWQNFPNPVSATTTIRYELVQNGYVELELFDISGKKITELVSQIEPAGTRKISWNGTDDSGRLVPDGVYLYRLKAKDQAIVKKLILIR